jgi:hypothetical protein
VHRLQQDRRRDLSRRAKAPGEVNREPKLSSAKGQNFKARIPK